MFDGKCDCLLVDCFVYLGVPAHLEISVNLVMYCFVQYRY
jgi:hypothetical protein